MHYIQFVFKEYNRHGEVVFEWYGTVKTIDAYLRRYGEFIRYRCDHAVRCTTDAVWRERRHETDRNLH